MTMAALERLSRALADRYLLERFVVEIKSTAALQHPHILPLFDSGRGRGRGSRVPLLRHALHRG